MTKFYKENIIYQIYPASFCDSNNDGWGDLKGIISRLDYIKSLGANIIWLSPIYESPMVDMGYDVSDYKKINSHFGTMKDFDELMANCKKLGIKVIMDLVVNHTSTQHKWFKEAINNPTTKYRDYYYFEKGKGKNYNKKPNNWQSCFAGSAWEKIENEKGLYYLHLYDKEQADLNYKNENVISEVENIMQFWLEKGVYGFRCDVISNLYKEDLSKGKFRLNQIGREHYENTQGNHRLLYRFRHEIVNRYNGILIGEIPSATPEILNEYIKNKELEMGFSFEHQEIDKVKILPIFRKRFSSSKFIKTLFKYQRECLYCANYFENHDQERILYRFFKKKNREYGAKAYATLLLTLKGTPFIYQGQEIGMSNDYNSLTNIYQSKDIAAHNVYETAKKFHIPEKLAFYFSKNIMRDFSRSPMQWNDRINAGFNDGWASWSKVNHDYLNDNVNVEYEQNDKNSILNFYKKMINIRLKCDSLINGEFKQIKSFPWVACFIRETKKEKILVVINLSNIKTRFKYVGDRKLLLSNYEDDFNKMLPPYFAGVYIIP